MQNLRSKNQSLHNTRMNLEKIEHWPEMNKDFLPYVKMNRLILKIMVFR